MQIDYYTLITAVVFVLSQVADVWSTDKALKSGKAHEANRFVQWLMDKFGEMWGLVKIGLACFGGLIALSMGAYWFLWIMSIISFLVAYHNNRISR